MKLKKLLTVALAAALLIGGVITTNAAELDLAWYAAKNPDVVAVLGNSPKALKQHYKQYGRKEGRMANDHDVEAQLRKLFKAEEYAALYPDVKKVFGNDTEAMFRHYISYGLLEARRPSEKVSQAAANTLKKTVEKTMADAGIEVKPGSAKLVEIITGTISADKGGAAVQAALKAAAPAVEKAVADTVKEATAPTPTPSSGGSSSSSDDSTTPEPTPTTPKPTPTTPDPTPTTPTPKPTPDPEPTPATGVTLGGVSGNDIPGDAAVAPAVCHAPNDVSYNDPCGEISNKPAISDTKVVKGIYKNDEFERNVMIVTLTGSLDKHYNGNHDLGYWIGLAVPGEEGGYWGFANSEVAAAEELLKASAYNDYTSKQGDNYTYYWGLGNEQKTTDFCYLAVKDQSDNVQMYIVDCTGITRGSDHTCVEKSSEE